MGAVVGLSVAVCALTLLLRLDGPVWPWLCVGSGLAAAAAGDVLTGRAAVACLAGAGAGAAPLLVERSRTHRRRRRVRATVPAVAEQLAADVRAGVPLAESLAGMADHGPTALRADLAVLAQDVADRGRLGEALDRFVASAGAPVAELAEILRVYDDVGGGDLPGVLEDLAARSRGRAPRSRILEPAALAALLPWTLVLSLAALR